MDNSDDDLGAVLGVAAGHRKKGPANDSRRNNLKLARVVKQGVQRALEQRALCQEEGASDAPAGHDNFFPVGQRQSDRRDDILTCDIAHKLVFKHDMDKPIQDASEAQFFVGVQTAMISCANND